MLWARLWTSRRRSCSGPVLLLVPAVCLLYHLLMGGRSGSGPDQPAQHDPVVSRSSLETLLEDVQRDGVGPFIDQLDRLERGRQRVKGSDRDRAVVVLGQNPVSDTEVQLYRRVLEQTGYSVSLARYADRNLVVAPPQGAVQWSVLVCLRTSEKSCLWSVPFHHLQPHQMVNLIPELEQAFSDSGAGRCRFSTDPRLAGVQLPMEPLACSSTNRKTESPPDPAALDSEQPAVKTSAPASPGLIAVVNVYVLVTSVVSLTAFLHERCLARGAGELHAQTTQLKMFLNKHLGPAGSDEMLGQVRAVVGQVLRAAVWASRGTDQSNGCLLCYQLLTFTLHFTGSVIPTVVMINRDLSFPALQDPFDGQITREIILEDTLHFLLPVLPGLSGNCGGGQAVCLPEHHLLLMLQFQRQLRRPGPFDLVYPGGIPEGKPLPLQTHLSGRRPAGDGSPIQALLLHLLHFHDLQRKHVTRSNQTESGIGLRMNEDPLPERELCSDAHLRQLYTDPPLTLSPPFSPHLKGYRAEVPFHTLVVRIRPQPASSACRVHLDDVRGPRAAHYPVGLGHSHVNILLVGHAAVGAEPVVMTTYTLHLFREGPPSLPLFGNHVTCGLVQDCGLVLQPEKPCGLEPVPGPPDLWTGPPDPPKPCTSGAVPGRWLVPCLSCADNRTCDWREVAWQPDDCYHPVVSSLHLQACLSGRKLLFIGDSTNRGIMYFLMERVNASLGVWEKAHETLHYRHLNGGRTHVAYSYYPQFWLEEGARPTFQHALEQLLSRSQPLANSPQTTLVVGGVQWLRTRHLQLIREVLERASLQNITVVIKSLGVGFHLPAPGIHSLSQRELQELHRQNANIVAAAQQLRYEVLDTLQITVGRFKDFLPGHCACHFHKVDKRVRAPATTRAQTGPPYGPTRTSGRAGARTRSGGPALTRASSYHVEGPVNAVYSDILLGRLCPGPPDP